MIATLDAEIAQIVQSIFSSMLNIEAVRVEDNASPSEDSMLATIQITGKWVGSVMVSMPASTSRAAASAMLMMPAAEVSAADEQDVAAELVNMIGGNIKGLLPGPSSLSLPTVIVGKEVEVRMHEADLIDDVLLGSEAGFLRVRLYARTEAKSPLGQRVAELVS
jgi:chemotaxis protein CheX